MPGYVLTNFFVYAIVNAFTPGPGNILALNTVTNYGWKKANLSASAGRVAQTWNWKNCIYKFYE